jgi:hypothetical protein
LSNLSGIINNPLRRNTRNSLALLVTLLAKYNLIQERAFFWKYVIESFHIFMRFFIYGLIAFKLVIFHIHQSLLKEWKIMIWAINYFLYKIKGPICILSIIVTFILFLYIVGSIIRCITSIDICCSVLVSLQIVFSIFSNSLANLFAVAESPNPWEIFQ